MNKDSVYRQHIVDAIKLAQEFVGNMSYETFLQNAMAQSAVVRQIEIIGEAAKRFSPEFYESYSNIPWKDIAGMRDKIAHDYMSVDLEEVWNVVIRDLPELKRHLS